MMKIEGSESGSGSISQRHGSADPDPDPHQNVMDPQHHCHQDFCLAHLFTDIKFEGGILGLAYVGSPRRNSVGGICTPEYFKNGYTLYLNSGLSSSRNHYGQRVITREADLVTAHEFGHNWGSEHDPDIPECSPSASQGGSYLMYTYSVSGYDVNNKKFSPCSLRFIRKVLLAKSSRCFTEPEESFCGNLRVEGDEECDAGLLGSEDRDPCCNENCKLKEGSICSDKNSPCCHNCQYMAVHAKCRAANYATCEKEAACTGVSADCPKSDHMPDETNCIEKGKCRDGKCIPFCETQGEQSCMCDNFPVSFPSEGTVPVPSTVPSCIGYMYLPYLSSLYLIGSLSVSSESSELASFMGLLL
jgi:disintegrin and metalloproteinase domain-containing protein 17